MMRMSVIFSMCCVALFLALSSVSAVQKLNSITDLKKINFGQSVPKHSLLLLYWFANTVDIDENNIMRLTFDPNREDYGSHYYHNSEGLLDDLPRGNAYQYYTIGNLNQESSMELPPYVLRPLTEYEGSNRDRIIIRVREQNTQWQDLQRIDQVYITQHYDISENLGTEYDPAHTYRITTNLMRQIREFSDGENQQQLLQLRNRFRSNADDSWLRHIRNTWATNLAGLGLLLYIVIQEKYSSNQRNNRRENTYTPPINYTPPNNYLKRQNYLDDASRSNVPRDFRNQYDVLVDIDGDEDHEANRTTGNRKSCIDSEPKIMMCCCIGLVVTIILSLGIYFIYQRG